MKCERRVNRKRTGVGIAKARCLLDATAIDGKIVGHRQTTPGIENTCVDRDRGRAKRSVLMWANHSIIKDEAIEIVAPLSRAI